MAAAKKKMRYWTGTAWIERNVPSEPGAAGKPAPVVRKGDVHRKSFLRKAWELGRGARKSKVPKTSKDDPNPKPPVPGPKGDQP